jgi:hypothetical protein
MPPPARVRAGVVAYAAGDALGVPWEGRPASAIRWEAIDQIPTRGDWPAGATSDDTAQLLLVARFHRRSTKSTTSSPPEAHRGRAVPDPGAASRREPGIRRPETPEHPMPRRPPLEPGRTADAQRCGCVSHQVALPAPNDWSYRRAPTDQKRLGTRQARPGAKFGLRFR